MTIKVKEFSPQWGQFTEQFFFCTTKDADRPKAKNKLMWMSERVYEWMLFVTLNNATPLNNAQTNKRKWLLTENDNCQLFVKYTTILHARQRTYLLLKITLIFAHSFKLTGRQTDKPKQQQQNIGNFFKHTHALIAQILNRS